MLGRRMGKWLQSQYPHSGRRKQEPRNAEKNVDVFGVTNQGTLSRIADQREHQNLSNTLARTQPQLSRQYKRWQRRKSYHHSNQPLYQVGKLVTIFLCKPMLSSLNNLLIVMLYAILGTLYLWII